MKIKTKKQILTEKLEMTKTWLAEIKAEYLNGERDKEDYEHELSKKLWHIKEAELELAKHNEWLDSIV